MSALLSLHASDPLIETSRNSMQFCASTCTVASFTLQPSNKSTCCSVQSAQYRRRLSYTSPPTWDKLERFLANTEERGGVSQSTEGQGTGRVG